MRLLVLAGLTTVALIDTASAADERYFSITVSGSGQFTQDYGEDRHTEGSRGFGTDGKTTISWRWKIKSVGRANGEQIQTAAAEFRRDVNVQSSTLEYNYNVPAGSPTEDPPHCQDSSFSIITSDGSINANAETDPGEWVRLPRQGPYLTSRVFHTEVPVIPDSCAFHEVPDPKTGVFDSNYTDFPVPRGAFNPKFDTTYSDSFQLSVNESREDHTTCCDPLAHSLQGSDTLKVDAKKISEGRAERRRKSYRKEDPYSLLTTDDAQR